jgi:hypothetical protein
MGIKQDSTASDLAGALQTPPGDPSAAPHPEAILYGCKEPPPFPDNWELPETFRPAHRMLEETARNAGLGILTLDERRENWRDAVLKLKGVLDPHGIEFPAIPEIGVDGKTVAFDPGDIIPVF